MSAADIKSGEWAINDFSLLINLPFSFYANTFYIYINTFSKSR